jgi:hypothetical protein
MPRDALPLPNLLYTGGVPSGQLAITPSPPVRKKATSPNASQGSVVSKWEVGSEANRVSYCDEQGVTHSDDALNVYLKVDNKKALRADLIKDFGPEKKICFPPMFSNLFGKGRFILCPCSKDAMHLTAKTPAHKYPADYRQRLMRHFR